MELQLMVGMLLVMYNVAALWERAAWSGFSLISRFAILLEECIEELSAEP